MRDFPVQTGLVIALVGAALAGARILTPAPMTSLVEFSPEKTPVTPFAIAPLKPVVLPIPSAGSAKSLPEPLLDDSKGTLDHFYRALAQTELKAPGAITRIVHYGDSPTTADLITGDIRAILQGRFGDSGHGFILPGRPWAWYQHTGASVEGKGWQMAPASQFLSRDGIFGLGGVSFTGSSGSSHIRYRTPQDRIELWFEREPGGGAVVLTADGNEVGRVDTSGEKAAGFAAFNLPHPSQSFALQASGPARIFGVEAERTNPGIVYDSLGLNGASVTVLSHLFNQEHWTAELRHRNPDLVIVNYGTNEADFASFIEKGYEKELREVIRRLHAALPDTSLMIMSPMDRGYRFGGEIQTMPTIPEIVTIQRRVAQETGCAFFDTFRAMGGEGTMARWYATQPRLVSADFIHPNPAGGKLIAEIFTRQIISGLDRYKRRDTTHAAVP